MKTIGLLGGMSWESTLEYYRLINQIIKEKRSQFHSARCVVYSLDFHPIAKLQHEGKWKEAGDLLSWAGQKLKIMGADFLVICTNTMHKVADQVSKAVGLPLLHIADATAEAIKLMGLEKVGLLGTKFTMEDEFYRERLWRNYRIKTIIPNGRDRKIIHRILYSGECLSMIRANHGEDFKRIINGLLSRGAQGIILGCTELPLMIDQANYDVPLFDTTRLHAEAAAALSLAEEISTR